MARPPEPSTGLIEHLGRNFTLAAGGRGGEAAEEETKPWADAAGRENLPIFAFPRQPAGGPPANRPACHGKNT